MSDSGEQQPGARLVDTRVRRGRHVVLDGLTTDVEPGVTVVVGANGAGKSTLLAAMAGLVPVTSGVIEVAGTAIGRAGPTRAQGRFLGYLPQEPRLTPRATVAEAIDHGRWLRRPRRGEPTPDPEPWGTRELCAQLDLVSVIDRPLGELSGGMNRLAMLAVAVVHRPRLLLLDEATAGIDLEHRHVLRRFLNDHCAGSAVVLSSHVSADLDRLADRVVVVAGGRFVFSGTPAELDDLGGEGDRHEAPLEVAVRILSAGAS